MTPRELADLLMRARAAGVLGSYFDHEPAPLAALLTFYGDERAAQERERCAQLLDAMAHGRRYAHYDPAAALLLENAAAALRALT